MAPDINDLDRYGRRTFITGLLSMGLSGSAAAKLAQERSPDTGNLSEEVPVPTAHVHENHEAVVNGEEPPQRTTRFTRVPRDRWERNKAAHDAARRLNNRFGESENVLVGVIRNGVDPIVEVEYLSVAQGSGTRRTVGQGGPGTAHGATEVTPASEIEEELPEQAQGVVGQNQEASRHQFEVQFVEREYTPPGERSEDAVSSTAGYYYDSEWNNIPAGCQIHTERRYQNLTYVYSTTCTPAWYNTRYHSEPMIVTAGHAFTGDGEESGKDAWQPERSGTISYGNCVDAKWDHPDTRFDAATSNITSGDRGISYRIANDYRGYRSGDIAGIVPWEALEQNEVDALNKQGIATGYHSDEPVGKIYPRSNYTYRNIALTTNADDGDSGGPFFQTQSNGSHLIAGIHYNGDTKTSYGTYIGEVEREFDITI